MAAPLRTQEIAAALQSFLDGETYNEIELSGNSEPTVEQYVETKIANVAAAEIFDPIVSIVPRGKTRSRAHRSGFDELHTVAAVVQRKLDPSEGEAANRATSLATAAMLEQIDDAVAKASLDGTAFGANVQAVYDSSEINPFWSTEDLTNRQISTHVLEITFVAEHEPDE